VLKPNLFDGLFWQNLHLVAPFSPMGFLLIFSTEVSEIVVGFFGSKDLPNTSRWHNCYKLLTSFLVPNIFLVGE
jgi:hypothetical protein